MVLTSVSLKLIKIKIKLIYARNHEFVRKKKMAGERYATPTGFIFLFMIRVEFFMIRVDSSPILFDFNFFIRSESIRVDPTRTGGPDFCTCLAKMFVCPLLKISHVMMKWCRRASHLGRFILWNNGRRATQLGRFTLWHYGRPATQLSRFTVAQQTLSFTTRR